MAKKKARKKTAVRKTTRKNVATKVTRKTTKRPIDLSKFSESQLEAALNKKRSAAIKTLRAKRAGFMQKVNELDRKIESAGGSAVKSASRGLRAGRGELAAAVLKELRRERTPKDLLSDVGHLIGGKNKAAIISQKLMALRNQGKVRNVSRGVWKAK